MTTANYIPPAKNALAVNVTRSWLAAVNVPATISKAGGCDISVTASDGQKIEVAFVDSLDGPLPDIDCLVVLAAEAASYKKEVALAAFHVITEVAGYGRPIPVDRGTAPSHQQVYGKELFLAASRHTEFRMAPNISREVAAEFATTVMWACRSFFARNTKLCLMHGYQVEDLMTYAWVWTHIFAHRHRIAKPTHKLGDDNQRLLTAYMKHRFGEFRLCLVKQGRSTLPSPDIAQIALMGRVFDANESIERYSVDPRKENAIVEDDGKKVLSTRRRRKAAAAMLQANLAALPHDTMVARLKEAAESSLRDYGTKREARRQLLVHFKACAHCQEAGMSLQPLAGGKSEEINVRRKKAMAPVDGAGGMEDGEHVFG